MEGGQALCAGHRGRRRRRPVVVGSLGSDPDLRPAESLGLFLRELLASPWVAKVTLARTLVPSHANRCMLADASPRANRAKVIL